MKESRLKTIALILWAAILGASLLFGLIAFTSPDVRTLLSSAVGQRTVTPIPPTSVPPATITLTPRPAYILLPSVTARPATAMPVTLTPTMGALPPVLQYYRTLSPDANPLTGLIPANPENLNRRPLAVKVSSFPRGIVRPNQSGLSRADLVYEYYIEDGLTRFIAVFLSQDASRTGPVRSGRYFDEYIMRMYHAALVFANADERVEKHLIESDLKSLLFLPRDNNCPPLCRDTRILGYNNVFVDTAGVGPKLSDNSPQKLTAPLFADLMYPQEMTAINRVYTHYSVYSYNYWEYDPLNHNYKRYSDIADAVVFTQGEAYGPHIDNLTGAQLSADNVIVLLAPHIFHNEFDRADQVIDIALDGSGDAYLFRDGVMIKARWVRDQRDQPVHLVDEYNKPVPIKPGVSYYQVIDPESNISQTGATMDFMFFIPLRKVTATPTPFGFVPSPTPRKSHK